MNTKLSAAILTHNNANTIERCLNSLQTFVDEIVIIDDFSQDDTLEKVANKTPSARIFKRKLQNNFAQQRNFSLEKCKNDWVIIIDSDEELSPELKNSISQAFENKLHLKVKAFNCTILNQNVAGWSEVKLERPVLMNKSLSWKSSIHESLEQPPYQLKGHLIHHSWEGMDDFINDLNKYSTWKTLSWINQGRNYGVSYLCIRQTLNFFYLFAKRYFYEKRFKLGFIGFLYCLAWASEELFVGLKFYEMKKEEKRKIN